MRLEKWFENGFINYKIKRNSCLYSYTQVLETPNCKNVTRSIIFL